MRAADLNNPLTLRCGRAAAAPGDAPAPGPAVPLLSMLPGLFCWALFASAAMPHEFPVLDRLGALAGATTANAAVVVMWAVSVAVSLTAALYYGRRPQAWHTTVAVAFHLAGLVFSLLLVGGLVVLLVA